MYIKQYSYNFKIIHPMATALKVKRDFRRFTQSKLLTFSTNVVKKVNANKDVYLAVQSQFTDLEKAVNDYTASFYEATSRSKEAVALKQEDILVLSTQLDEFASAIEGSCKGSTTYIIGAGFEVMTRGSSSDTEGFEPPMNIDVRSNGLPGTVIISFTIPNKSRVKVVAVEWTTDEGEEKVWHNGTYFTAAKNVMSGLPELKRVSFRFRCIGTGENKSSWSEVM